MGVLENRESFAFFNMKLDVCLSPGSEGGFIEMGILGGFFQGSLHSALLVRCLSIIALILLDFLAISEV